MPRAPQYDRQEALDQAVRLFWSRGYHATSLKHLEQSLDMRPGSLYAAFGNKETLFLEALDRYAAAMASELQGHLKREPSALEALRAFLRELVLGCLGGAEPPARACMIVKTLLEVSEDDEPLRTRVNALLGSMELAIEQLLKRSVAQGDLRSDVDPGRLARVVQVQIMGLRTYAQRDLTPGVLESLLADVFSLLDNYRSLPTTA
ncbi:TetR family transcriptional regulator [Marinimicrobium koreense]|uniref:TetR family transcriptional regulator n=1 Tax=Marinimicrobium koreense TaxID=306545 RepID=A0A3N1P1J1_9GAMM|nr:TetR/AcrR family transcriptional regulator [Marinimicrobium koreense]ROQ21431.1 TetR family transcriptional regulator [Marinimicrobium koreense]